MADFSGDYFFLAFASSLGVLLFATARSRLWGVLLFHPLVSQVVGAGLVVGAFTWFFASEPRNIPDTLAGIDGNQQAMLFAAGALLALLMLLGASSIRNWAMTSRRPHHSLDDLRESSYLRLILQDVKRRWTHSKKSRW